MKVKDLKALARERLLGNYSVFAVAKLLHMGLALASLLASLLFLLLGCLYAGAGPLFHGLAVSGGGSKAAAAVFFLLFLAGYVFTLLLNCWLSYGYKGLILDVSGGRHAESARILRFFSKGEHPWKVLGTSVLKGVFIALNAVIPGMVYSCGVVCGADFSVREITNFWYVALILVSAASVLWAVYLVFAFAFAEILMIEDGEMDILDALRGSMKLTKKRKLRMAWLFTFSFLFWGIPLLLVPVTVLWIAPYMEMTVILFYRDCKSCVQITVKPDAEASSQDMVRETALPNTEAEPSGQNTAAQQGVTAGIYSEEDENEEDGSRPVASAVHRKRIQFPDIDAEPEYPKEE